MMEGEGEGGEGEGGEGEGGEGRGREAILYFQHLIHYHNMAANR